MRIIAFSGQLFSVPVDTSLWPEYPQQKFHTGTYQLTYDIAWIGHSTVARIAHLISITLAAVAIVLSLISSQALAQGEIKSNHGDWNLFCDTPPGAPGEQCSLVQNVVAEDQPNVGLTVVILKTADGKNWLMRVLAPLGVLLPSGLGLKIDDIDVGRTAFVRCLANGCIAEAVMQPDLLEKLQAGENAMFIVFKTPEQGVGVFISLNGFKDGLVKLQE